MIESLDGMKETVNYNEIRGFRFYDNVDYESYPSHWHSPIEILMSLKNTYEVTCNNTVYTLNEGDLLFINSGILHGMSALAGERLIFQVDFSLLQPLSYIESASVILPPVLLVTKENAPEIHGKLKTLMLRIGEEYSSNVPFSGASIYSLFLEIYVLIGRHNLSNESTRDLSPKKQKEYTEKFIYICNYIRDHCTEDLCLDDIAALAGFSKYHFTRLFKGYTGTSFYRYLNIKRIECAQRLLIDPELSVTQVALQSGFSNSTSFIRMFKLITECTPTEFRSLYEGRTPAGI